MNFAAARCWLHGHVESFFSRLASHPATAFLPAERAEHPILIVDEADKHGEATMSLLHLNNRDD